MSLDSASIVPPKQREENYENYTKFFNRIWRFGRAPVSKTGCRRFESCIRCHRGGQRVPCPGSIRTSRSRWASTPPSTNLRHLLSHLFVKLSRKQGQLPPTSPSKGIFPAKQKSPKSQARSHFSGIFVVLYSVTPAYKPVPYRTAADIGFRYGQKSLLQSPHHKHDWSNCGRSAAPATLSNPLSCRKQKPA